MTDEQKYALDAALRDLERAAENLATNLRAASRALRNSDFDRRPIDTPDTAWKQCLDESRLSIADMRRVWARNQRTLKAAGWPVES